MDQASGRTPFGTLLRRWRRHRGHTQLALSLAAEVSARHLSWLESGKAAPSRTMVLRLAERLELPLRERNVMLAAAGFAPLFRESKPNEASHEWALATVRQLLAAYEPWPALAVDRHWHLVAANRIVGVLLQAVAPELLQPPVNVLRLAFHPQGLAPMVEDLAVWRGHVLGRLARQIQATGDAELRRLHEELRAGGPAQDEAEAETPAHSLAYSLVLNTPWGRLRFVTTLTVFGSPHDVMLSELALETLLPADAATAEALRAMQATLGATPREPGANL